ncbi:MAG: hypothetical protein H6807_06980 [Planctomycetes bacterium]|nr:hypothetical protein [Planctomycetota bacterium]
MPARSILAALLLALLVTAARGQTYEEAELYVADRGLMSDGSDGEVRLYNHAGFFVGVLPQVGSGQIRGIETSGADVVYLARGNEIRRYSGPMSTPDVTPFASGNKAQDVAVNPVTGNVWCAFGTSSSSAQILEVSPAGALLRTITSSALVHPRSLDWSYDGQTLFVCNQTAADIVTVDEATGTVSQYIDLAVSFPNLLPQSVSVARDVDDLLYVTGDYGGDQKIIQVTGPAATATATVFLDYSMASDILAPADGVVDNHGNVWFSNRDANMGVPGVYCFDRGNALQTVLPWTGSEHISPIDLAFRKSRLDLTLTSLDGVDGNGVPKVPGGAGQTTLVLDILAPDFVGSPYAILYSLLSPTDFAASEIGRPFLGGVPIERPDPRNLPLFVDDALLQSIGLIQAGGIGALIPPNPICGGIVPGFFMHPQGVIGANGIAQALLIFPAMPCLYPAFEYYMNFAVVVVDGATGPAQLGLVGSRLNCVRLGG